MALPIIIKIDMALNRLHRALMNNIHMYRYCYSYSLHMGGELTTIAHPITIS